MQGNLTAGANGFHRAVPISVNVNYPYARFRVLPDVRQAQLRNFVEAGSGEQRNQWHPVSRFSSATKRPRPRCINRRCENGLEVSRREGLAAVWIIPLVNGDGELGEGGW